MLPVLITILKIVLIFVCFLLGFVVLMQRPKQEGLGAAFGGGVTDQLLGSGTTDFLQRATVYLGILFFVISLLIASMTAYHHNKDRQVTEGLLEGSEASAEVSTPSFDLDGIVDEVPPSTFAPAEVEAPVIEEEAPVAEENGAAQETDIPSADPEDAPAVPEDDPASENEDFSPADTEDEPNS